jgi:hypothetical protein
MKALAVIAAKTRSAIEQLPLKFYIRLSASVNLIAL